MANRAGYWKEHYAKNRDAQIAKSLAYAKANPEKVRARMRRWYKSGPTRKLGLARTTTESVREFRGCPPPTRPRPEVCELCGKPPTQGRFKVLCVDHDHVTGKFRGWLCFHCNTGLGKLGDDEAALLRALEYLRRPDPNAA